jgi:hypothetical protein
MRIEMEASCWINHLKHSEKILHLVSYMIRPHVMLLHCWLDAIVRSVF